MSGWGSDCTRHLRTCFLAVMWTAPLAVGAQSLPLDDQRNFDVNRFRPAQSSNSLLNVEVGEVEKPGSMEFSLWYNYLEDPFVLRETDDVVSLVTGRHEAHLVGFYGVNEWLQVGLDLPVVLQQVRSSRAMASPPQGFGLAGIASAGIGDVAITPKFYLWGGENAPIELAVLARTTIATAFPREAYLGEHTTTFMPEVAASRRWEGFHFALNVGGLVREPSPMPSLGLDVDHELIVRVAVGYDLSQLVDNLPLQVIWTGETFTPLLSPFATGSGSANGAEMHLAAQYIIDDSLKVLLGGGLPVAGAYGIPDYRVFASVSYRPQSTDLDDDGVRNRDDECPEKAEDIDDFQDTDGCPELDNDGDGVLDKNDQAPNEAEDLDGFEDEDGVPELDNDRDGIEDAQDTAPNQAEDLDGFEDEDGAPDLDNDGDGIADQVDQAPNEAEDLDGFEDEDGVPDPDNDGDGVADLVDNCPLVAGSAENKGCKKKQLVEIRGCKIDLSQKVYFASARSTIQSQSYPLLNNMAEVLQAQTQLKKIRIEGHTDSAGSDSGNLALSQARAEAVVAYLTTNGAVEAERLEAIGLGETRPIADNETSAGRDANRRVEFHISGCEAEMKEVEVP